MKLPRSYRVRKATPLLLAPCSLLPLSALAAEKITYEDHILPIFEQSCTNCHNPDKKKGDLDLSNYPGTMAGGSGGKIAVPGDGGSSKIYAVITHTEEPVMPPEGDKLEKKQADLIRAWIDGGLLETKSSTAKKPEKPKIALAVNVDPASKPEGPPPMPEDLSLEPPVVGIRAGIVKDMASSPWAPLLAVTGQKQVLLYNTDTLRLAGILPFPAGQPEVLSFHPTGRYLLAGGGVPGKSGTTITWEIKSGKEVLIAGKEFDSVIAASLRPDLGGVTTGGPSRLVKLWDTQTDEQLKSIKKHTDWVTSVAYSPDGILLATGGRGGNAYVWEAATGNEFHTFRAHKKAITAVSWRADSNVLATASEDGDVIFWEMNDGRQVKKIQAHGSGVLAFDYARDGHFVTSGRDKRVKIWKPDFNLKKELPAFGDFVVEVAFSHDGKRLFTADFNGKVEAWDANTFAKAGEINANPPRIADRIAWLEKELKALPAATRTAEDKFKAAEAAVAAARKTHQETVAKRDGAKQDIVRLEKESAQLGTETKQLDQKKNQLAGPRQQRQKAVEIAENTLNDHRQALDEARRELARTNPGDKAGTEKEQELAAEAKKWREQSEAKKDDAGLKRRAEEAERRHNDFQQKLLAANQQDQGARKRVAELEKQRAGTEGKLHQARKAFNETNAEWNRLEKRHGEIAARMKLVAPRLQALRKQLPQLEKAIKPAQDAIAAKDKEVAPLKTAFEAASKRQDALANDLKFWKAAAINTRARHAGSEFERLKRDQDGANAAFKELSQELGKLRQQLQATEDPEAKKPLQDKIKAASAELGELRTTIDQRAPKLAELQKQSAALKAKYAELKQ